jgi:glycosyltransferase involved in cell wall biosynthesis
MSLRVALDGRELALPGGTGVARYIRGLTDALSRTPDVEAKVFPGPGPKLLGVQVLEPWRMRRWGATIIHGPANALPLLRYGFPAVVTVHDLAIYDHPEWFPGGQWLSVRVLVPESVKRSKLVICPSRATAESVMRIMRVPGERCRVIPHGIDDAFLNPAGQEPSDRLRARLSLPERFLLQVGTIQPRKNYETTIRALHRIPAAERIPLVAAGAMGWGYEPVLRLVSELEMESWVRFIGYVQPGDLPALYRLAEALLFPSLEEGFGLPVLEAFACRTPVIASRAGAIPEVAGDAALLHGPKDDRALAQAIGRLLTDGDLRERLVSRGGARAASFTWDRCARSHIDAYREAAGARGPGS